MVSRSSSKAAPASLADFAAAKKGNGKCFVCDELTPSQRAQIEASYRKVSVPTMCDWLEECGITGATRHRINKHWDHYRPVSEEDDL